jgi:hypothetical protein
MALACSKPALGLDRTRVRLPLIQRGRRLRFRWLHLLAEASEETTRIRCSHALIGLVQSSAEVSNAAFQCFDISRRALRPKVSEQRVVASAHFDIRSPLLDPEEFEVVLCLETLDEIALEGHHLGRLGHAGRSRGFGVGRELEDRFEDLRTRHRFAEEIPRAHFEGFPIESRRPLPARKNDDR